MPASSSIDSLLWLSQKLLKCLDPVIVVAKARRSMSFEFTLIKKDVHEVVRAVIHLLARVLKEILLLTFHTVKVSSQGWHHMLSVEGAADFWIVKVVHSEKAFKRRL